MTRNIIKYGGLALVIIGIIIVMKNLFASDTEWQETKKNTSVNKNGSYNVSVSLLDKETEAYVTGAKLIVKDGKGNVVEEWTTDSGVHLLSNLKNGSYTLIQESTNDKYFLNSDVITFEVKDKDQKVTMYNIALTEEEIRNGVSNTSNNSTTNPSEVGVENTLSTKSIFSTVMAFVSIILGSIMIYKVREDL